MNILTEKEREDVYKYWLSSSTLTNEDGLIQLAERAVHAQFIEQDTDMEVDRAQLRAENKHLYELIQALQNGLDTLVATARRAYIEPWRTSARDITSHVNFMMVQGITPYAKKPREKKAG